MNGTRGTRSTTTSIPFTQAYQIQQTNKVSTHREVNNEIIGAISIAAADLPGTSWGFDLNPLKYVGTRLNALAKIYQKYRFKSASLKILTNFATTVQGSLVVGYNSNPDYELTTGMAINQVFSLNLSKMVQLWTPTSVAAQIQDRNKWYNLDLDSPELMETTQGAFHVVVQNAANITGTQSIAVMLEYDVEFTGSAINASTVGTPATFPAGTWTYSQASLQFAADAGEPSLPSLAGDTYYYISPKITFSGEFVPEGFSYTSSTTSFFFYDTKSEFDFGGPYDNFPSSGTIHQGRFNIVPFISPN